MIKRDLIKLVIISSLTINSLAYAAPGGGYSGGNNGNGVGNTGPGNQGNDKPAGNAGGGRGNPGNGNTGGFSGGNNGNGVGNTGPGNQGNDRPVGNACGRDCGTSTTTTGSSQGGSTGGTTTGDTTSGGTSGGTTTGETSGGTSTGETSGGTTTGETSGGTSGGETSGGTSGGETSGGTTGGVPETTEAKEQFKARLLPLGFGNYDIQNKAVNLTKADERDGFRLDDYQEGFIVTQMRMWDAGLGGMVNVFIENGSALASLGNLAVGLAPTKGRYVQYERLVSDEKMVDKLKALPLPAKKKTFDLYQKGESAYFESNGGIVFLAGAGLSAVYAGGSVVAEGSYKTLVKKADHDRAIVQIVKAKLRSTSLYTGALVVKLDGTKVKQLSEGFNFEFDFSRGGKLAVSAYEQLLAGNMTLAQEESKRSGISGVRKISDSKSREFTKKRGISVGIPMVALYNWSAGKTYGESAMKAYADRTTTELNYGVSFKEEKGRFFHKHRNLTRAFYASKAITKDESNLTLAVNEEANYLWRYENDAATSGSLKSALAQVRRDFGLGSEFNPVIEKGQKLRFVRVEANVNMPEQFLREVISDSVAGRASENMKAAGLSEVEEYFSDGDKLNLCKDDDSESSLDSCRKKFIKETFSAISRIQKSLSVLVNRKDASSYTFAMALMGKDVVKNPFVLNAFLAQDKSCSVTIELKLEGRRLSRMMKKIPGNRNCR